MAGENRTTPFEPRVIQAASPDELNQMSRLLGLVKPGSDQVQSVAERVYQRSIRYRRLFPIQVVQPELVPAITAGEVHAELEGLHDFFGDDFGLSLHAAALTGLVVSSFKRSNGLLSGKKVQGLLTLNVLPYSEHAFVRLNSGNGVNCIMDPLGTAHTPPYVGSIEMADPANRELYNSTPKVSYELSS